MNPVIQAQVSEFVKGENLSSHDPSRQFEMYSAFSIVNGLLGETIDPFEVHLGGDEFGIDGVAVVIQGELVTNRIEAEEKLSSIKNPIIEFLFFQAKTGTAFDYGDISKFFDAIRKFFNGELAGESEKVDNAIDAMKAVYEKGVGKRNPRLNCYYVTTGNYEAPSKLEQLKSSFRSSLDELNIFDQAGIAIEFVGAKQLQQWYRAATNSVEVEIDYARNVVMPSNLHVEQAYIGYLDAFNLLKLYTLQEKDSKRVYVNRSVFIDNIRDYDPNSDINISIKNIVKQEGGSEFVFRNNGITAVSREIDRTGDKFRLEDYQIVNGCQTSNIIFDLIYGDSQTNDHKNDELARSIQVPFRLIGSTDDNFVASIIIGTNRQNPVREEQFWALRPFMKSLEEYSRNLESSQMIYFERRENQYRNENVERTRIVQPAALMKAVAAALLFQPHRAARDYRGIISEYEKEIFLDSHDVRLYHAVAYVFYKLEFLWRNQRLDNRLRNLKFYLMTGIGLVLTGGKLTLSLPPRQSERLAAKFMSLALDEESLKQAAIRVGNIVGERLSEQGVSGYEKVREAIRSDTFATAFKDRLSPIMAKGDFT